jgi:hypothetical protein
VEAHPFLIGLSSEQFPDYPLEQNVVTLQPIGDENLFATNRRNQFPGQELRDPHPLAAEFLEQQLDDRTQPLLRRPLQGRVVNLAVLAEKAEKLPIGLQDHRLVKSFLASEVVTDAGNIGSRAFADFTNVRSVKPRLGEKNTGSLKDTFARRWGAISSWRTPGSCFLRLGEGSHMFSRALGPSSER